MSEYQVLARKYRPKKLSELIGQDVLVKTLSNAINQERIPHAMILTGIRGVGKTSTARIIARSLLCKGVDGNSQKPTTEPCGVCESCVAIEKDTHIDVVELDAASRTGIDNVREIIEQIAFAPLTGRYKVYIIDEVHMISKQAFNAFLKTLEEPPAHVKFIFATTEIKKIPVTILSRCMRFDLPRVEMSIIKSHLLKVSQSEGAAIEDEALNVIAEASEGSVRDSLSLLDQAIALSENKQVQTKEVINMVGMSERNDIYNLIEHIISGNSQAAIIAYDKIYNQGVDATSILQDILRAIHKVILYLNNEKLFGEKILSEVEENLIKNINSKLDIIQATRLWQIISKSLEETHLMQNSNIVAHMCIVKACLGSKLPTPAEILKFISEGNNSLDNDNNSAAKKKA